MTYYGIPGHITGLYVFAVVNLCALLNISLVSADVYVIDVDNNTTVKTFPDRQAMFGPSVPDEGLVGRLVYANPHDACESIQPPPQEDGVVWIALISRGPCHFDKKVWNAQQAKFAAAIVHNYKGEDNLVPMAGDSKYADEVKIPSVFVGYSEGMLLANNYNYTNRSVLIRLYEDDGGPPANFFLPFLVVCSICVLGCIGFVIVKLIRYFQHIRRTRLSKSALKKIPTRKYKKGEYFDSCAICLEDYEEGEKLRVLPCNHTYHCKCIDPWLTKRKKTCPQCKRRVIPGHDTESESDGDGEGEEAQGGASETTPLLGGASGSGARSSSSLGQGQRLRSGSLEQSGTSTSSRGSGGGGRGSRRSRGQTSSLSDDGAEEPADGQHVVVVIPNSDINTTTTTTSTTAAAATSANATTTATTTSKSSSGKSRSSSKRKRTTASGREKREKEKRSSSGGGGGSVVENAAVASTSAGVGVEGKVVVVEVGEEVDEAVQGAVGGVGISDRKDFEVNVVENLPSTTANTNNTLVVTVETNQEPPAQAELGSSATATSAQPDPESNPPSSESVLPHPQVGPQGSINGAFAASFSSEEEGGSGSSGGGKKSSGSKGGLGIGARKKQRRSNSNNSNDSGSGNGGGNNTGGGGSSSGNMVV